MQLHFLVGAFSVSVRLVVLFLVLESAARGFCSFVTAWFVKLFSGFTLGASRPDRKGILLLPLIHCAFFRSADFINNSPIFNSPIFIMKM